MRNVENGKAFAGGLYRVEVVADLFGVSVRRIQQLTQEGVLPTTDTPDGRRYDLVSTVQKYTAYLSDKAYGRSKTDKEAELKEQKLRAEIALKNSQAELHKLKTAIEKGEYIEVSQAVDELSDFMANFKKFAYGMTSRLAGMLTGYVDATTVRSAQRSLRKELDTMLNAFVDGMRLKGDDQGGMKA